MRTSRSSHVAGILIIGTLGGIAGGLAEIGWIGVYGIATGTPLSPVARGIVESMTPALAASAWALAFGVFIHLGLAVVLGIALTLVVRLVLRRSEASNTVFGLTLLFLTAVWALNFFVVLPQVNPAFVHLLPYGVTLLSKLLFGLATATVFYMAPTPGAPGIGRFASSLKQLTVGRAAMSILVSETTEANQ
jgi:hypothetical protein